MDLRKNYPNGTETRRRNFPASPTARQANTTAADIVCETITRDLPWHVDKLDACVAKVRGGARSTTVRCVDPITGHDRKR
jgi:hypothetical protein